MQLIDLIKRTRSYRRFDENHLITEPTLRYLVDHARLGASARNQQSLKYIVVNFTMKCRQIFPLLSWAGYLKNWSGPAEGERPTAYIIVLHDKNIAERHFCDEGIAMQNILLAATELKLGGCIIASVKREKLRELIQIPEHLEILDVIALGKPTEEVVLEEMEDDNYEYWRDEKEVHHVPKRPLDSIVINWED